MKRRVVYPLDRLENNGLQFNLGRLPQLPGLLAAWSRRHDGPFETITAGGFSPPLSILRWPAPSRPIVAQGLKVCDSVSCRKHTRALTAVNSTFALHPALMTRSRRACHTNLLGRFR